MTTINSSDTHDMAEELRERLYDIINEDNYDAFVGIMESPTAAPLGLCDPTLDENLSLYLQATGRPDGDARFIRYYSEVLQISPMTQHPNIEDSALDAMNWDSKLSLKTPEAKNNMLRLHHLMAHADFDPTALLYGEYNNKIDKVKVITEDGPLLWVLINNSCVWGVAALLGSSRTPITFEYKGFLEIFNNDEVNPNNNRLSLEELLSYLIANLDEEEVTKVAAIAKMIKSYKDNREATVQRLRAFYLD